MEIIKKISKILSKKEFTYITQMIYSNQIFYKEDLLDLLITITNNFLTNQIITLDTYYKLLDIYIEEFKVSLLEIKDRIKWLNEMGLANIFGLRKNHDEIYYIFDNLNRLFQKYNIEHYYTSGILAFLLINKPLERYHHDIDIFVNFKDLELLEKVSLENGFTFERVLGDRLDGTKRIMLKMYYRDYEIPITVLMYVKNKDLSIIQKDYYFDSEKKLMVEDIYNSPLCAKLSFSENINYHNNIPYKSISLEALYMCKDKGRKKDIYDCNIMKPYVDLEKLTLLKKAFNDNFPNKSYYVDDNDIIDYLLKDEKIKKIGDT